MRGQDPEGEMFMSLQMGRRIIKFDFADNFENLVHLHIE